MQSTTAGPLPSTYRNALPYPFCPGCGHGPILDALDRALVRLEADPRRVVLVSDIGCSGLSDQYFVTHAFHGLHGRSITYASGIKLVRPQLDVIVVMGDGSCGIGGSHLLSAARRNIGITVLVLDNLNFGMTGGQHSSTTPPGARTATTPAGHIERPLDICATVALNGAGYVWRGTSFDEDLDQRIAEAIRHPGLSLLDVWELCTAYFVPRNRFSRRALVGEIERLGFATGVVCRRDVEEYGVAYRRAAAGLGKGSERLAAAPLANRFTSRLERPLRLVVAGSAGTKVRSAVRLLAEAAVSSGLWAAQRDDYPVTVQTGHSVSELVLSPRRFHFSGVETPDVVVVLSPEGLARTSACLSRLPTGRRVFAAAGIGDIATAASLRVVDLTRGAARLRRRGRSLAALAAVALELEVVPAAALEAAAERAPATRRDEVAAAVECGIALASSWAGGADLPARPGGG